MTEIEALENKLLGEIAAATDEAALETIFLSDEVGSGVLQ